MDFETTHILPPLHPGEVLREEYIVPLGLTAGKVAKACGIARTRIERIVAEEIGISGDTALRLGRVFATGPELWMNLQSRYAVESARVEMDIDLDTLQPFVVASSMHSDNAAEHVGIGSGEIIAMSVKGGENTEVSATRTDLIRSVKSLR